MRVALTGPERAKLPALRDDPPLHWVFAVDGRQIGLLPALPGEDGAGFTIYFPSWEAAQLAVPRLRPPQ